MKWKTWMLWILPFAIVGTALLWSYRARTTDLRPIASLSMRAAASAALRSDFDGGLGVAIWVSPAPTTTWANDRLPDWAKTDYIRCVAWQTDYYVIYSQDGEYLARGVIHGWVAVNKDEETWIFELTRSDEISGETVTLIDAWDGPPQEDGA